MQTFCKISQQRMVMRKLMKPRLTLLIIFILKRNIMRLNLLMLPLFRYDKNEIKDICCNSPSNISNPISGTNYKYSIQKVNISNICTSHDTKLDYPTFWYYHETLWFQLKWFGYEAHLRPPDNFPPPPPPSNPRGISFTKKE